LLKIGAWKKTNEQLLHSSRLKLPNSPAADVIGVASAAGEPVGPRARASTGSPATVDANLNRLARARVVRDQFALGNTGHPDGTGNGR
jgi:hypothetical protein